MKRNEEQILVSKFLGVTRGTRDAIKELKLSLLHSSCLSRHISAPTANTSAGCLHLQTGCFAFCGGANRRKTTGVNRRGNGGPSSISDDCEVWCRIVGMGKLVCSTIKNMTAKAGSCTHHRAVSTRKSKQASTRARQVGLGRGRQRDRQRA